MFLVGALTILFVIGYISFIKLTNDPVVNLNVQLNVITNELNNTIVPTIQIKVKENDDSDRGTLNTHNVNVETNIFLEFHAIKDLMNALNNYKPNGLVPENNHFSLNVFKSVSRGETIEKSNEECSSNLQSDVNVEPNNNELLDTNLKELSSNSDSSEFDNSTLLLLGNNTFVFEVFEESQLSTKSTFPTLISDNLVDLSQSRSDYFNFSNVLSAEFLNNVDTTFEDSFLPSADNTVLKTQSTRKLDNGIYIIRNPCLHKECKISSVKRFEFNTEIPTSKLINEELSNLIYRPFYKEIGNKMALYYDDMSFNYIQNDYINYILKNLFYLGRWIYVLEVILIVLFWRFFCFYRSLRNKETDLQPTTMMEYRSIGTGMKGPLMSKIELINHVSQIKKVQDQSLAKMEDVLSKTNIKLQYILEKIMLFEDCIIHKNNVCQSDMLSNFHEHSNKDLYEQISDLRKKHMEGLNDITSLSLTLNQTKDNMEELRFNMQQLIDSQHDIKTNIDKLSEHCTCVKTEEPDSLQLEYLKYPTVTYNDVNENRSYSETDIAKYGYPFNSYINYRGETVNSVIKKYNDIVLPNVGSTKDVCNKKITGSLSAIEFGSSESIKSRIFSQKEGSKLFAYRGGVPKDVNHELPFYNLPKIKNGSTFVDYRGIMNTTKPATHMSNQIKRYSTIQALKEHTTTEILVTNPLFQKQMVQNMSVD